MSQAELFQRSAGEHFCLSAGLLVLRRVDGEKYSTML